MKKIVLVLFLILCFYFFNRNDYNLTKDAIRFRVISNSNSYEDIKMKEKTVNMLKNRYFTNNLTKKETKDTIISNINVMEDDINYLFKENNYDKKFNINYGMNYFPKKEYKSHVFNEGYYESLVIEIGDAKGNNYWCIMYPQLCLLDEDNSQKEYSFKILDFLKKLW